MAKGKLEIQSKDRDGKDITVYVTRPTNDNYTQAQVVASKAFKNAIFSGALLKEKLEDFLIEQGIWTAEKEKRLEEYDTEIRDGLLAIKRGGIKLSDGKDIAVKVRVARTNRTMLLAQRAAYDDFTVESQAENAKFDYLVSVCLTDDEGNPVFSDMDDYRNNGDAPFVEEAAGKLATLLHGLDQDWEADLPENQFLKKHKFVDNDLRLVNKDGEYVTVDDKRVDENFRYIDDDGNFINEDGELVGEDGLPIVEFTPFLDDDGNPIVDEDVDDSPKETTKKRGRPRKTEDKTSDK